MAVKIRLKRMGSKKAPFYRIVVCLLYTSYSCRWSQWCW